jgi:hypothetical protein
MDLTEHLLATLAEEATEVAQACTKALRFGGVRRHSTTERTPMDTKTQRKHLTEYNDAARQIELAQVCINVLEAMRGNAATRCIRTLKAEQQRALTKMDAAANRLGAPYPTPTRDFEPMGRTTSGSIGMP